MAINDWILGLGQPQLPQLPKTQPGFMGRIDNVLRGGLLGDEGDAMRMQSLLGLGAGMLNASGPSTTPVSLGQVFGQGIQGMQGAQQAGINNAMNIRKMAGKLPGEGPSSVQEWKYYNSLPEADQKRYLEMKRSMYSVGNVGSVPTLVPHSPGMPTVPLSTLPNEVNAAAALEAGKTGARVEATGRTEAALDLPKVEAAAQTTTRLIDELVNHPGKKLAVGAPSFLPTIPGTSQADFIARLEQVRGDQFLQAFQALKGSGTITEIEGQKAESAIARMQRAQSVEAFDQAARDYKEAVSSAANVKRQRAGQPARPTQPTSRPPLSSFQRQ